MSEQIEGLDMSKWQGALTAENVTKMVEMGIKFVYHKVSQGTGYNDPRAANNIPLLQAGGLLVGAYHFTTIDAATPQYNQFINCMGNIEFDLPPAMDCEAYTATNSGVYSISELRKLYQSPYMLLNQRGLNYTKTSKPITANTVRFVQAGMKLGLDHFVFNSVYGLSYPTAPVIDSIGRSLTTWMKDHSKLLKYPYPAIYTNMSSGNKIFTSSYKSMNRYLLWVANWKTTVPNLPAIWYGLPYFVWQDNVIDGTPYLIDGQVDHDLWGDYMEFPGEITPPPPTNDVFDVVATHRLTGKVYTGTVTREI